MLSEEENVQGLYSVLRSSILYVDQADSKFIIRKSGFKRSTCNEISDYADTPVSVTRFWFCSGFNTDRSNMQYSQGLHLAPAIVKHDVGSLLATMPSTCMGLVITFSTDA